MELTIRDWMVIVGVLLIVAVFFDAWRRVRSDKNRKVKVKLIDPDELPAEPANEFALLKELPNGGARVVERGDILRAAGLDKPRQARAQVTADTADDDMPDGAAQDDPADAEDDVELIRGMRSDSGDEMENLDWLDGLGSMEDEQPRAQAASAGKLPRDIEPEVFMLNVVARSNQGFRGEDILHILLACDMRYGDMSFFHRHEFEAGRGAIQFSVANMMQPGVFEIDNMSDMSTPGLVFFLTMPGPEDMMKAFDYMLETAQAVSRNLGGDVLDESRSALTRQSIEHCRQRIRDLERRLLARAR